MDRKIDKLQHANQDYFSQLGPLAWNLVSTLTKHSSKDGTRKELRPRKAVGRDRGVGLRPGVLSG